MAAFAAGDAGAVGGFFDFAGEGFGEVFVEDEAETMRSGGVLLRG